MLSTPESEMPQERKQGSLKPNQSPVDREQAIRMAIQKGIPLHRIESWLDWMELAEQTETPPAVPAVPENPRPAKRASNPLPESG